MTALLDALHPIYRYGLVFHPFSNEFQIAKFIDVFISFSSLPRFNLT